MDKGAILLPSISLITYWKTPVSVLQDALEGNSLSGSKAQLSFFGCRLGGLQHLAPKGHPSRVSLSSPGPGAPPASRVSWCLVFRDGRVAVPMVDLDMALTAEVCLEDIAVAMVPPPGA